MSGVGREMRSERNDPHPGLRWTQVRDTVRMLNLAVAQVTMSMRDGDDSTSAMGRAFTGLAAEVEVIRAAAEGLAPEGGAGREEILEHCAVVSRQVGEFVVAFQFYDRLSQRLAHVSDSLGDLAALVADPGQVEQAEAWEALQSAIRGKYTMAEERAMFDALMAGGTVAEALALLQQPAESEVELF